MAGCSVKQGFLMLHDCGADAQFSCAGCGVPICTMHASSRPQAGGWLCPSCAHQSDTRDDAEADESTSGDAESAGASDGSFAAGLGFAAADHLGFTSGRSGERDPKKGSFDDS